MDSQSGAPVVLINSFLGLSNTLYRMRVGTASLTITGRRDGSTLSGTWQALDPVTSANGTLPASSNGIYATFNWAHEFSPNTTGMATVQYGRASFGQTGFFRLVASFGQTGSGHFDTYALAATLSHRLSETLTTSIQVAWTSSTSSQAGQGYTQGVIRAGLRRTF